MLRAALAAALGLAETRVRVVVPDVGGGFGLKVHVFPEDVAVAALARRLGRPVKWVEERRENLTAAAHAREQRIDVEVAADAERAWCSGCARACVSDAGAYHIYPAHASAGAARHGVDPARSLPRPRPTPGRRWPSGTNKPPLGAYRGVGMTMGAFVMERDARPARRAARRSTPPRCAGATSSRATAYPFTSASGMIYDSGDFPEGAGARAGAGRLRRRCAREQAAARAAGPPGRHRRRLLHGVHGHGLRRLPPARDGRRAGHRGGHRHRRSRRHRALRGQLPVPGAGTRDGGRAGRRRPPRRRRSSACALVPVRHRRRSRSGSGTFGSRGGGVDRRHASPWPPTASARRARARWPAHRLEAARRRRRAGGRARARPRLPRSRAWPSRSSRGWRTRRPRAGCRPGSGPGWRPPCYFDPPGPTFSGAVHVAVVEVDRETGPRARVCGTSSSRTAGPIVNPLIVDGQIHGAVAQGLGEALLEALVYDADGQLLTATLMDYALPRGRRPPRLRDRPPRDALAAHARRRSRAWVREAPSARRRPSPTPWPTPSARSASESRHYPSGRSATTVSWRLRMPGVAHLIG